MSTTSVKIKRPLWVAGLNIALALSVGTTQAFAVEITSVEQLLAVNDSPEEDYFLKNDLVLSTDDVEPESPAYIFNTFNGTFDGGGFIISGLTKPLFNAFSTDAAISDLTLEADTDGVSGNGILSNSAGNGTVIDNVHVSGDVDGEGAPLVGGLVGDNDGGEISNSSASGNVGSEGGDYVGGLVGYNGGTIYNSYATAYVNGTDYVGGLVGDSSGTITNSYATGSIGGVGDYVGGLVGDSSGTITNSYATGSVGGVGDYVGGLVGDSSGTITNSYATGYVDGGSSYVGGLVGDSSGTITNSYATGYVDGGSSYVGGLVGDSSGTITNSYATGYVDGGSSYVGGLVGDSSGTITNSYATGNVDGEGGDYVGGLAGDSSGTITNSYATGNVDGGSSYVGGLVGDSSGTITNSYATGNVDGEGAFSVGGLVGSNNGDISNSYAAGGFVIGFLEVGGLVGANGVDGEIERSYSHNTVTGIGDSNNDIGGLVGYNGGEILGSYAISTVTGEREVGGLVGENWGFVTNSYTAGYVTGDTNVGGLVGYNSGNVTNTYAESTVDGVTNSGGLIGNHVSGLVSYSFSVNNYGFGEFNRTAYSDQCVDEGFVAGVDCGENISPFPSMLQVINTGLEDTFAYDNCINSGIPYLVSLIDSYSNGCEDLTSRINFSYLLTQALDVLKKSVGFKAAKSDLSKLDLALLDQVKGDKSAQIIGGKLFSYQSPLTSLSVGSLLQLEINFEANKSLQMWVKSLDDQYVLVGDITFDKDGNAILPGIEFKKSGSYEFIFVNSDKKGLTQPELMNKVIGLTVYVN
jgi:hypothetical protein